MILAEEKKNRNFCNRLLNFQTYTINCNSNTAGWCDPPSWEATAY